MSSSLGWTIEANNIMKSSKLFWRRFDLLFYLFKIQSLTKKQKHLWRNIASCASVGCSKFAIFFCTIYDRIYQEVNFEHPTPKGLFMNIQKINLWTFMAHWWTFLTKKNKDIYVDRWDIIFHVICPQKVYWLTWPS